VGAVCCAWTCFLGPGLAWDLVMPVGLEDLEALEALGDLV